ncbi:MAG: MarC family protein [Hyphomicrobiales bacterium]|uniref:MarC family protein n=1 Tax=Rhabdaerophilum calidifontis TaxID=2604328 RepID=UPI0012396CDB|nr:MarC family protein [Rhabdaerophilum calidifontis]MCA1951407.1 MarC family protein [Hyphomicrobiales bacterium]MCA1999572.1 MarC family protein [Hyphomicrobiales bacterium]
MIAAPLLDFFLAALTTLMVTVDPPGLAPIFLSLTLGMAPEARRSVAFRATLIAGGIMLGFAFFGQPVLGALGIGLPAFRIAGGLLLFWIAFEMVFELRNRRKSGVARTAIDEDHIRNVAAFPLAIPLMAGPGTITATMLIAGSARGEPVRLAALVGVIALVSLACLLVFLAAERLSKLLGITGNLVLTRLLGVILAALAVQFVIDGVRAML